MNKFFLKRAAIIAALCACLATSLFVASSLTEPAYAASAQSVSPASCYLYAVTFGRGYTWGWDTTIASTVTCSGNNLHLIYQQDGNLVLYCNSRAIWASNTADIFGDSADKTSFQTDGNFVVYSATAHYPYEVAVWASGTNNKGANVLVLQRDGNLVIYRGAYSGALWATGTNGKC